MGLTMIKNDEVEKLKAKILPVLKEYKVTRAGIFGSYARGEQKKKSDVDILIKIGDDVGFLTLAGLKLDLQGAVKKKVDLVEYENIRQEIRDNILNDEIRILQ